MSTRPPGTVSSHATARATSEVLHLLRRHHLRALRRNRADIAFTGYMVLFVAFLTVPPVFDFLYEAMGSSFHLPHQEERRPTVVALLSVSVLLSVLWGSAREARVRGPLQLSEPMIDRVLTLPVDRARFLIPSMFRAVLFRALVGAVGAPVGVVLLGRTVPFLPGGLSSTELVQVALGGALVGVLSGVVGVLVIARGARVVRVLRPWHATVQLLLLTSTALVWLSPPRPLVGSMITWSGPWGWLAQPVTVLTGDPWAMPWIALALSGAVTAVLVRVALRSLPLVGLADLRERGAVASGLRSGVWMSDPSWFQTAIAERHGQASGLRVRLRPPRHARLLVAWRDLLGALRAPYPVLVALLIASVSTAVTQVDTDFQGTAAATVALVPLVGLYVAGSRLMSGARMGVADPRRARFLPPRYPLSVLALTHGVWPLCCLVVVVAATSLIFVLVGDPTRTLAAMFLALPALVVGALAGVYRGLMPDHLFLGVDTPFGNTAPLQIAVWHLSGLLGALAVTWPTAGGLSLGSWWMDLLWTMAGTALLTWWVRRKAHRTLSGRS